jgi:hypothetical protein
LFGNFFGGEFAFLRFESLAIGQRLDFVLFVAMAAVQGGGGVPVGGIGLPIGGVALLVRVRSVLRLVVVRLEIDNVVIQIDNLQTIGILFQPISPLLALRPGASAFLLSKSKI